MQVQQQVRWPPAVGNILPGSTAMRWAAANPPPRWDLGPERCKTPGRREDLGSSCWKTERILGPHAGRSHGLCRWHFWQGTDKRPFATFLEASQEGPSTFLWSVGPDTGVGLCATSLANQGALQEEVCDSWKRLPKPHLPQSCPHAHHMHTPSAHSWQPRSFSRLCASVWRVPVAGFQLSSPSIQARGSMAPSVAERPKSPAVPVACGQLQWGLGSVAPALLAILLLLLCLPFKRYVPLKPSCECITAGRGWAALRRCRHCCNHAGLVWSV